MIYLDYAAATPIDPQVLKKMAPFLSDHYGNPSATHRAGREARAAIENGRSIIAKIVGAREKDVLFTSGGTEANNWAIFGLAEALKNSGSHKNHIISTPIEHESVLEPLKQLELKGFKVTYLPVNSEGLVEIAALKKAITKKTGLASIIYANNEIGTIQNIKEITTVLKKAGVVVHTDACQAAGYLPIRMDKLGVDAMTINSSKIYGPKGAGALILRENLRIAPLLFGGGQEFRMRAGTENSPAIVGFAQALQISEQKKTKESARLKKLQSYAIKRLTKIKDVTLNGPSPNPQNAPRLPNNINLSIKGVNAESLLVRMDMANICASAGSACSSGSFEPSHVLLALNKTNKEASSSIRLSLGRHTSQSQLKTAIDKISKIINDLRSK